MPMSSQSKRWIRSKRNKNRQQLLSVNTIERIAERIHKTEASKERINLVKRNYLYSSYVPEDNYWADTVAPAGGFADETYTQIDYTGRVTELSNIAQVDVNFLTNAPQNDDPMTGNVDEKSDDEDADGSGQGAPTESMNGRRLHAQIKISAVSAFLRVRSLLMDADYDQYASISIRYAFVLWKNDGMNIADGSGDFPKPTAKQLLQFNAIGFHRQLDASIVEAEDTQKIRVLCRGECSLTQTTLKTVEFTKRLFKKFDDPIIINYEPTSQNGQKTAGDLWKLYFVCRSNIPRGITVTNQGDPLFGRATTHPYKPLVNVCTKVHYFE